MKYIIYLIIASFSLFLFTRNLFAEDKDFSLSFQVEYVFDKKGNATVTKRITLVNLNVKTYPSAYMVDVPDDASDIAAFDNKGKLEVEIVHEGGRKIVRIPFPSENVGINEKTEFVLSFHTRSLAIENNHLWYVEIPPFSADEHIVSYKTKVTAPEEWGNILSQTPLSKTPGIWDLKERDNKKIKITYGTALPSLTQTTPVQQTLNNNIIFGGIILGTIVFIFLFLFFIQKIK